MEVYLGWIALSMFIVGGLFRSPRTTILFAITGNLLFLTSYILSSSITPAINIGCATSCALTMLLIDKKHLQKCMYLSMSIATIGILATYSSTYDFLIIIAGCLIAFANSRRDNYIHYKLAVMGSQFLWIIYTLQFADYPMLVTSLMTVCSNTYSLARNLHKDGYMDMIYARLFGLRPAMVRIRTPQQRQQIR